MTKVTIKKGQFVQSVQFEPAPGSDKDVVEKALMTSAHDKGPLSAIIEDADGERHYSNVKELIK